MNDAIHNMMVCRSWDAANAVVLSAMDREPGQVRPSHEPPVYHFKPLASDEECRGDLIESIWEHAESGQFALVVESVQDDGERRIKVTIETILSALSFRDIEQRIEQAYGQSATAISCRLMKPSEAAKVYGLTGCLARESL